MSSIEIEGSPMQSVPHTTTAQGCVDSVTYSDATKETLSTAE